MMRKEFEHLCYWTYGNKMDEHIIVCFRDNDVMKNWMGTLQTFRDKLKWV